MRTTVSLITAGALALATTACTTTYDAYGRPVQSVDPGAAAAGAAAAGVLGYAIGRNNNDRDVYVVPRQSRRGYYHHGGYRRHGGHWHRR